MVDVITPRQLNLLALVAKHPGLDREKLLTVGGATAAAAAALTGAAAAAAFTAATAAAASV